MATAKWMQRRANRAWEDLENTVLDYITILLNIVTLTINVVMIIYRRSERQESDTFNRR